MTGPSFRCVPVSGWYSFVPAVQIPWQSYADTHYIANIQGLYGAFGAHLGLHIGGQSLGVDVEG